MPLLTLSQGSHIVSALLALPSKPTVHAIARRDLPTSASNLKPWIESDILKWADAFAAFDPKPPIFLSALGTTRAQAGGVENQRKIDYDLNLALAKAAKASGVRVYVLISSAGISKSSPFPYGRMKVELEDAVKELGFEHTVILRPGMLLGKREGGRTAETIVSGFAKGLGKLSGGYLVDFWGQDAGVVAKAAVAAGAQCLSGEYKDAVWPVDQAQVVKLGKATKI